VEDFVLSELQNYCAMNALQVIEAQFKGSGKNKPFVEFLARTHWLEDPEANTYSLLLNHSKEPFPHHKAAHVN
jgi:hypothetical protein